MPTRSRRERELRCTLPSAFDLTVTSLFLPLLVGRTVVLVPEKESLDGLSNSLQAAANLSPVKITPAHLVLLGRQLPPDRAAGRVRVFVIGGEALVCGKPGLLAGHAPETRLVNEYGPTETVVGCCVYEATGLHRAIRGRADRPADRQHAALHSRSTP